MVDIPNFYDRAIALLASQFQIHLPDGSNTNFQNVIASLIAEAQFINTQEQALQTQRYLDTAVGKQLDGLGQILGLVRVSGQSDSSYREDLQFQIFINQSHGTPEEMISIIAYLTNASKVWYIEISPASYILMTNGTAFPTAPNSPQDLVPAMQKVSPAGVEFSTLIAIYNTVPFVFAGDTILEQFYVSIDPADPSTFNPFQVNPGSGLVDFFVNAGTTTIPSFGGYFSEAVGVYPTYVILIQGAGQLSEAII
jgi:hypothetical protein